MDNINVIINTPKADRIDSKCPLCNSKGIFSFKGRDFLFDKTETYQYMQCNHCAAVYQEPMPSYDQIVKYYPQNYGVYTKIPPLKRFSFSRLGVLNYQYNYTDLKIPLMFKMLSPVFSAFKYRDTIRYIPNGRGLDIGCGNGKFIRDMNSLGWLFEGVEFNSIAVNICRNAGLKVFHGDLLAAGFKDNSFDVITARHVIEHIPDPAIFMREIVRILKNGGRLVIKTPNSKALGRRWFGPHWFNNDAPRHLILFSSVNLKMLADHFGLRQITVKTFTGPRVILNSLDYLTANRDKPYNKHKLYRFLARLYVLSAIICRRGDELFAIYEKP
ncbi:MAG: methyltransferase domain-containing protein [Deltaproteobacteria bacterium]|nr:methyltransferase domain-containing protein [Deltaproteobacteria bacterium]